MLRFPLEKQTYPCYNIDTVKTKDVTYLKHKSPFLEYADFPEKAFLRLMDIKTPAENNAPVITPPHYQMSAELILCDGIRGTCTVNGFSFDLEDRMVIYIPPGYLHSVYYTSGDGTVFVAKIEPEFIVKYIDLTKVFAFDALGFESFDTLGGDYDRVLADIRGASDMTRPLFERLSRALDIFSALKRLEAGNRSARMSDDLMRIIDWTEENMDKRILLADAAAHFGYSRNYFCEKFRLASGDSYLHYLTLLRVSKACRLLSHGKTMAEIVSECGFSSESYFIRVFRHVTGMTPARYRAAHTDGSRI